MPKVHHFEITRLVSSADSDSSRNGSIAGDDNATSSREQRVRRRPRWMATDSPDDECNLNPQLLRVVLDDLMGHTESWPFIRPVSRQEVSHGFLKLGIGFYYFTEYLRLLTTTA